MDTATPAAATFNPDILAQVPIALRGVIDNGDLSGAVTLIWRKGEIVEVDALGQADIAERRPMARDTLFRIASMTKPVTTAAALMLMEEGVFQLADSITKWAPEFADMKVLVSPTGPLSETTPAPRDITFDDLMTHRAGLAYGFTSVGPIAYAHQDALGDVLNSAMTPDAWMKALGSLPLSYPPGERFHYSHATDVLGFIVGRMAGKDFREVLIERIFAPLGMKDTDFFVPADKRARAAVVYRQDDKTGALEPVAFRTTGQAPAFCGGGGGLISTADDYLKFARLLLGDGEVDGVRLLKPETVELMRTNRLTEAQRQIDFLGMPFWLGQGFGLGLSMVMDPVQHAWMGAGSKGAFGWPGAFGTWWQADPAEDMILVYLIQNSMPLGPEAVTQIATNPRMGARLALPIFQKQVYAALGR
ncbi:MAG TPA: serine hydrolase domain-containing protein [Caulobacteraceae bacterium]|jgi:CubicO group peptidase (beta-lactamase class C family)|nr:serine hydrolase domain-containing protein [Caulobacteraceae bacterium]